MDIHQIKIGMWIEFPHGIGKVVAIDHLSDSVIIENPNDQQTFQLSCDDLHDQPQLHSGCDQYY
ncbi:hypothetical protein [Photobacterium damselae]|uniref:Uncharacterized protein n=1 Tax=Photobacterium damselae TaxID=38293 RepID=A0ACD3SWL3_PHODM|nr:hypothetical protein [Photobacterium damselae]ARR48311.1 hypothetical protein CAY62_01180 [Photobacterium damselae subsp. damselae]AWK82872.1 hypothetical protein BST98_12835 [Photobacterium damselae]EHA1081913.1 hypothetical protein [Photobacterium damselae]ELI6448840.1 hypothetical protein [Photobacterium damselae]ELV7515158.1 hypothetical protein [Photobacterium damselae]